MDRIGRRNKDGVGLCINWKKEKERTRLRTVEECFKGRNEFQTSICNPLSHYHVIWLLVSREDENWSLKRVVNENYVDDVRRKNDAEGRVTDG